MLLKPNIGLLYINCFALNSSQKCFIKSMCVIGNKNITIIRILAISIKNNEIMNSIPSLLLAPFNRNKNSTFTLTFSTNHLLNKYLQSKNIGLYKSVFIYTENTPNLVFWETCISTCIC